VLASLCAGPRGHYMPLPRQTARPRLGPRPSSAPGEVPEGSGGCNSPPALSHPKNHAHIDHPCAQLAAIPRFPLAFRGRFRYTTPARSRCAFRRPAPRRIGGTIHAIYRSPRPLSPSGASSHHSSLRRPATTAASPSTPRHLTLRGPTSFSKKPPWAPQKPKGGQDGQMAKMATFSAFPPAPQRQTIDHPRAHRSHLPLPPPVQVTPWRPKKTKVATPYSPKTRPGR